MFSIIPDELVENGQGFLHPCDIAEGDVERWNEHGERE
jgi:hypothetical protein